MKKFDYSEPQIDIIRFCGRDVLLLSSNTDPDSPASAEWEIAVDL